MFLTVSALVEQHIRSFCLPNREENHLKQATQLGWKCNTQRREPHFQHKLRLASSQILTTIWSSEATDTLLSSK